MLREVKEGQGFICKDLEEKKRIWQKLGDAGYPMFQSFEIQDYSYLDYPHIVYHNDYFCFCKNAVSMPLNEAEFFGENEWTPKAGDKVLVYENKWYPRVFVCEWKGNFYYESEISGRLLSTTRIRQIQPDRMTRQEAQEKLRELLNKPNLIIEP
jgi:hypothetical protein